MAENALLKVLLDEGSYLPMGGAIDCGVETGLGTVLSRPVSILLFSQQMKRTALHKIAQLLDKTLSTGTPLILLFSDCEIKDEAFSCGVFLQKLIRLSGVCPIAALVENETGETGKKILPFADFVVYASGMHEGTCSTSQALDLPAAVEYLRTLLSFLPLNCAERAPLLQVTKNKRVAEGANSLIDIIADSQALFEIYRDAHTRVCFARINGRSTGVLYSENGLFPQHATRFIQFCDCYSLPILIATDAALMLNSQQMFMLAQATVPKLCVGDAGENHPMFDLSIGLCDVQEAEYDLLSTSQTIRNDVSNAFELLCVKRDVLPPHKHGNMPV